jgi:hypothetical protein
MVKMGAKKGRRLDPKTPPSTGLVFGGSLGSTPEGTETNSDRHSGEWRGRVTEAGKQERKGRLHPKGQRVGRGEAAEDARQARRTTLSTPRDNLNCRTMSKIITY